MDKELLMLHGARFAVKQLLEKGSYAFLKKSEDGTCQTVEYTDICNYLTDKIDKYRERENGDN